MPTPANVTKLIADNKIEIVDLKFIDLPGLWQHFSIPVRELKSGIWEDGTGFDGSSIRGFQHIHESDMLLVADPSTAIVDPACTAGVLVELVEQLVADRRVAVVLRRLGAVLEERHTAPVSFLPAEVLRLVADGHSDSEIARRLFVSTATVRTHLQHVYRKLESSGRAAAVATAMRRGLID